MPRITPVPVPTTITELADLSEQINQAISSETLPDGITLQGNSDGTILWIPPTTEEYNIGIDTARMSQVTELPDYTIRRVSTTSREFPNYFGTSSDSEIRRVANPVMYTPSPETTERLRQSLDEYRNVVQSRQDEELQTSIDTAREAWRESLNNIPSSRPRELYNPEVINAANEMMAGRITVDEATRLNIAEQFQAALGREINSHQAVETNIPVKEKPPIEEFSYYKHFGALVAE